MKYWLSLMLVFVLITACEDELEFNSPAFEANKDDVYWKSSSREVSFTDGTLTVLGKMKSEVITLEIPSAALDTFKLGVGKLAEANYSDENGVTFSTLYNPVDNPETPEDESLAYYSEGEIVIDEINTGEGYVSGSFWFTAYDTLGEQRVNFNQGVFYHVSLNTAE